jgi:hypothetical protein
MSYRLGYHVACGLVELELFIRYGHRDRRRVPDIRATLIDVIGAYPLQSADDAHYLYSIGARLRAVWPEGQLLDAKTIRYAAETYSADAAPAGLALVGGFEGRGFERTLAVMLSRLEARKTPERRTAAPARASQFRVAA